MKVNFKHNLITPALIFAFASMHVQAEDAADTSKTEAVATLEEVTVKAASDVNDLLIPYAGGQVARGGRIGLLGDKDFLDTPFSTTNFTSDYIVNQQARTLTDVVSRDASVSVARSANQLYETFLVRGFPLFSYESAFNGLYGVAPGASVALESIERVELFKGPNAFLNGIAPNGAIAGGVNIAPKRATNEAITRLTGDYSGDSLFGGAVDIGRRFGEQKQFGVRFNALKREGDTAVDRQHSDAELVSLGVDFKGERIRLSADIANQKRALFGTQDSLDLNGDFKPPRAPNNTANWVQSWQNQTSEDLYGVLRGEFDVTKNITTFAAIGGRHSKYGELRNYQTLDNTAGDYTYDPYYGVEKTKTFSTELGVRAHFSTGVISHQASAIATRYEDSYAYSSYPTVDSVAANIFNYVKRPKPNLSAFDTTTYKYSANTFTSYALADTLGVFDEKLQLTVGARYQRVKSEIFDTPAFGGGNTPTIYDEHAVTPAFGVVVKPWQNVSLYANYIEGLSQGPTAPIGTANQGQVFPPFKSDQQEAGVKIDFGKLAATVSVFQIAKPNGLTNPVSNVFGVNGEQRNRGLEINTFGEIADNLRLLGGVTYTQAKLTKTDAGLLDGNIAQGVPKVQAKIGTEWDVIALSGLTLTSDVTYVSSQFTQAENTFKIPSYAVLDLGARYVVKNITTPITLRAGLDNVFDKDYWSGAYRGLSLGAPRRLNLSATFDF